MNTLFTLGPLDVERWLMQSGRRVFVFDTRQATLVPYERRPEVPQGSVIQAAGRPGRFLIRTGPALQVWDAAADTFTPLATLADGFVGRWWVHGGDLTFDCGRYAVLWHDGAFEDRGSTL